MPERFLNKAGCFVANRARTTAESFALYGKKLAGIPARWDCSAGESGESGSPGEVEDPGPGGAYQNTTKDHQDQARQGQI